MRCEIHQNKITLSGKLIHEKLNWKKNETCCTNRDLKTYNAFEIVTKTKSKGRKYMRDQLNERDETKLNYVFDQMTNLHLGKYDTHTYVCMY